MFGTGPTQSSELLKLVRSWKTKRTSAFIEIASYCKEHGSITFAEFLNAHSARMSPDRNLHLPEFEQLGLLTKDPENRYQLTAKGQELHTMLST